MITKIVNSLTAASEIGGPMAAMYLLKHPDHYTGHQFRTCYWRSFVAEVMHAWDDSQNISEEAKTTVVLGMQNSNNQIGKKQIVALSPVIDYMWRPSEFEDVSMYDWIRKANKRPIPKSRRPKDRP